MRFVDITLLIFSSLLGFFLAVFIARKRRAPGSQALSVLIVGASLWSLGYAFEILASSISAKLLWERFEYFGIVIIPLAWFTFVAQYLGFPKWMEQILKQKILLGIIPVATLVLAWTNDLHHLVWQRVELEPIGSLVALDLVRGPWFWVLMIFSNLLMLLGSIQLAISVFSVVRLQRWQIFLTLLAILLPWVGNIAYLTGWAPERYLDWTGFLFLISGVMFTISLVRFNMVNILPIAQGAVFAGLSAGVLVLDGSDCIVEMNRSAREMMHCSGEESLGKNLMQVMPELGEFILKAGNASEYQAEFTQGEGSDRQYYDLHISLLTDPYHNPIGHVVVLNRITQLKQDQVELEHARQQLEEIVSQRTEQLRRVVERLQQELVRRDLAEKRFEAVIESAPEAMLVLDQLGRILLINAMAERLFGYPRQELVGMSIVDNLVPERYRDGQQKYFQGFLQNPQNNLTSFGVDLYASRKDGTEFPMEVDLSRLEVSNGYWVAINVRDISERKRAELALRESEQTYRALFENAGDGIFLIDLTGKILRVNQKSAELLGFSQEELQTLSIQDITVPDELSDMRANMDVLVKGKRLIPYIGHYLKKSGEILPTENNTVLVRDGEGKPRFFQNITRDISERILAEQEQRRLVEEIRESNEQMRDLALRLQEVQELERQELAAVLHDRVGQNLTGLNLNLTILQNQIQDGHEAEIQKRLADSLAMVEETTHKIRDVMADLNPPVLDEYGLIAAIKWYCGDFTNRTGITTHVNGGKTEPRLAVSVEKILFRLVQESMMNVAKHAHASQVLVKIESNPESMSVTVKDNGIGFDPLAVNGAIGEPHWGLLSMQRKAASIGADLAINSTPGMGTTVCIQVERSKHDD